MKLNEKHQYDIDILSLLERIKLQIKSNIQDKERRDLLTKKLKIDFKLVVDNNSKLKIEGQKNLKQMKVASKTVCLLEEETLDFIFFRWLYYLIYSSEPYQIYHILSFHFNFTADKVNFVDWVEFQLTDFAKEYEEIAPIKEHLIQISNWVSVFRDPSSYVNRMKDYSPQFLDERIKCQEDLRVVREYFQKLVQTKNKQGENLLSTDELASFLYCNFKGEKKPNKPVKLPLDIATQKGNIIRYVYEFHTKYDHTTPTHKYHQLLKKSFLVCAADTDDYLKKHFSDKPLKSYPF